MLFNVTPQNIVYFIANSTLGVQFIISRLQTLEAGLEEEYDNIAQINHQLYLYTKKHEK